VAGTEPPRRQAGERCLVVPAFRNPLRFEGRRGFEAPADRRLLAMLAWRDVNASAYGSDNRGAAPQT
jgi:hypothetical protein